MTLENPEISRRLQHLDEYAFEEFVAELWERRGWDTEVTTESNDKGIDVIATRSVPYPEKEIIQAKRYRAGNRVGRPELQQYASLNQQERDADKVIVVCTSSFTDGARAIAEETNVKCVDGAMLAQIVSELNATDLVERYTDPVESEDVAKRPKRSDQSKQTSQEATRGDEQLTLVEHGDELTAELVGLESVKGKVSSGGFVSSGNELDGIMIALKLFNQSDDELVIESLDAFSFRDQNSNTYSPINLGTGEFDDDWKKHGGGITFDHSWIGPGSRVKYAVGVSLPSHAKISEITLERYNIEFNLDHEARRRLPDLPTGIKSAISG